MFGQKLKIDKKLLDRATVVAKKQGYASVDEFIVNLIERELTKLEEADATEKVEERLRGLGYIE